MLDDAIEMVPKDKLADLVGRYIDLAQLQSDGSARGKRSLLTDIENFDKRSRSGEYYEDFNVNSKNYTDKSGGTQSFIADCRRLLDRCIAASSKGNAPDTRRGFEIIFKRLQYIDEGNDDVVFFADEGGSWQVGVDWERVIPAWIQRVALTAEPEEFGPLVIKIIDSFDKYNRVRHLATARKLSTAAQRKLLDLTLKPSKVRQ